MSDKIPLEVTIDENQIAWIKFTEMEKVTDYYKDTIKSLEDERDALLKEGKDEISYYMGECEQATFQTHELKIKLKDLEKIAREGLEFYKDHHFNTKAENTLKKIDELIERK